MASMAGKVAIVTGASSGIGRATAIAFGQAGATVVVVARRPDKGEETVQQIKATQGEAMFIQADVTQASALEAMVNQTVETYGRLDYAFNNAGSGTSGKLADLSEADWDFEINANLKSVWLSMKYEIPAMQQSGGGAIVNTSSQGALLGVAGYGAYGAAKAGVIALSRAAAAEYSSDRIRINTVSPGAIKTDLWAEAPPEMLDQVAAGIPLQRIGRPEDIAEAVVWLCSEGAGFVTGHNLVIDGGFTAVQK
ncbi:MULTISPECIES: glucose 1-dehydrogenase [Cyanophyceae]|uniref:glucose 1-dehydrogenase n=1 Tax=Cyanophyceae TaxID=3028117 RepID=UPI001683123D|nr:MULTISPECIES: glucose 1-dehydrogenase [Cyanophyceae]MBD1916212.1 glucose 1-dehydrogenase [Phormidium sp. FACHB-77]MBD2031519.1 glucose 1-dehydrogenase [Phormidium sp. FACHB-322]MBD2052854.1 glucose 1-dehydrogenase [Leptolyngbya sp. FACHB-60]